MLLCQLCNEANGNAFDMGQCHICGNRAMETDRMTGEAAALIMGEDAGSFAISTIIPKEWLIREEDAWDRRTGQSVKGFLNGRISRALQKATSLRYDSDGDCRIILDYAAGTVALERNELFIFGRYRKLVAGLSQSRWMCAGCQGKGCAACSGKGKNYESVEERIGEPAMKAAEAAGYVLHASGREDVDATNSAGRPFVLALAKPARRKLDLGKLADGIGKGMEVAVESLRIVPRAFVEVVTESHFDKEYEAEVEFGRSVNEEDLEKIRGLAGKTLLQQTPTRVAHRRADLVRHRKVKSLEVVGSEGNTARVRIVAEAGTYIKEFISGDDGRTKPSMAGTLGMTASCKRLAVTRIDDGYLDLCLAAISRRP